MVITSVLCDDIWVSLVRRGMLVSECESVEYWQLNAGNVLELACGHGVDEVVIVLEGSGVYVNRFGEYPLFSDSLLYKPRGDSGVVAAIGDGLEMISIRTLPESLSQMLPVRVPELPLEERSM